MFNVLGSLLARSVAPAVAEQLARSGMQALQTRLRRDPTLAPATSAEIVAAINHYNAPAEPDWTRERLFAFVAFFVSAGPDGAVSWIETPARIVDYVLRGVRPGEDTGADRAAVASALEAEMDGVRELMVRYLALLAAAPGTAPDATQAPDTGPVVDATQAPDADPAPEFGAEPVPEPATGAARANELLARVAMPAGAAFSTAANAAKARLAHVRQTARRADDARKARTAIEQSLKLLHAGGVGLAQAETYLLRKGHSADVVRAVVAERVRGA